MTVTEFSNEFDIHYNGIATNSAPPLDLYEKSVYLTKAQLEIIKNYFNPRGNKYQDGFENSSKRRNDLIELILNYRTTLSIGSGLGINENSKFFIVPSNLFLVLQETAKVESTNSCVNGKYLKVVPKTHDEYNVQIDNPFKNPDDNVIWRMDHSSQGSNKTAELISIHNIVEYKFRYIKYPSPIILTNLLDLYPGENLSIDGITQSQTCKLNESTHREILDRAVELALSDYKPEMVQIKAQMGLRNE